MRIQKHGMKTVFVASGTSENIYHTVEECYHLKKVSNIMEKELDHIEAFYNKCGVCDQLIDEPDE